MSNKAITVYAEALKRQQQQKKRQAPREPSPKATRQPTRVRDTSRAVSRDTARMKPRGQSRELPTRDEIQEFSFHLRDELKVKVQAEVPHQWQTELQETSQKLNVKKLELYRFILGEFLGKVRRKKAP